MEQEMLSILGCLKEYKNILVGQKIIISTNHKNLTFNCFYCDRVMHWRLPVKKYGPTICYVKGSHNVVADTLSHLDILNLDVDQEPRECLFQIELPSDTFPLTNKQIATHQKVDPCICAKLHESDPNSI